MRKTDLEQANEQQTGDFMQESEVDRQRRERLQNLLQENSLPPTPFVPTPPPGVRRPGY
jgi:hypothetical protein